MITNVITDVLKPENKLENITLERTHPPPFTCFTGSRNMPFGTGSALLGSALILALGFGMLIFSSLTPFQQFGIVTAITIAYALIAAVVEGTSGDDPLGRLPALPDANRGVAR